MNSANFSKVITGRSKKQQIIDIIIAVIFAVAVVFVFAFTVAVVFVFVFAVAGAFASASAVAGAFAGAVLARNAIDAFAKGQIIAGLVLSLLALIMFAIVIYMSRQAVKGFKNVTGTDFQVRS